jgi:hypothetical protein
MDVRVLVVAALAGCNGDLPAASFIDKLRVLAVKAEPPEVSPGQKTTLTALAVEPLAPGAPISPLSAYWLSCVEPSGVLSQLPCGVSAPGTPPPPSDPPRCADQPSAALCVLGEGLTVDYTPDRGALSADGTGQRLVSVTVSDTAVGALGCLHDIAGHDGIPRLTANGDTAVSPSDPNHCVVALKRLSVSDPARITTGGKPVPPPNTNPGMDFLGLGLPDDKTTPPASITATPLAFLPAAVATKNTPKRQLTVRREPGAAELKPDGTYENLTVAWFTTGGKIDGGRSSFTPAGCASQVDCATTAPAAESTTDWEVPTADIASKESGASGMIRFWAVIRDDRGGVDWLDGSVMEQP